MHPWSLPPAKQTEYDFDVLVGGHLTRLGTKEDVQVKVDFFAHVLAGAESGLATVSFADVVAGTGIGDPSNPNVGNTWCVFVFCGVHAIHASVLTRYTVCVVTTTGIAGKVVA